MCNFKMLVLISMISIFLAPKAKLKDRQVFKLVFTWYKQVHIQTNIEC